MFQRVTHIGGYCIMVQRYKRTHDSTAPELEFVVEQKSGSNYWGFQT